MKNNIMKRAVSLLLALVCVLGVLPLSAFAAGLSSAPASITQRSSDYMKIGGRSVRYKAASSVINNVGLPYVFDEQVTVPGLDAPVRALCAYQKGTLGPAANGQKWNFQEEVNSASLKVLLTYVYSHTYGDFTEAGDAIGLEHWNNYWSDIWFMVAQAMSWYYEHGIIKDVNSDREGFIEQAAEEFVAAMKLYHETYGQSSFIKDWSKIGTHSIIDSSDGGVTGNSAYDYIAAGVNSVMDHPENYLNYHLWTYEWDKSQPWKLAGQSGVPMQRLLIAVPDPEEPTIDTVRLTVKKLEAGTNKPMAGVTFKIENANDPAAFSVTRETGADGTITLTKEADNLSAGQYQITEEAVPEGYVAQTASQLVTVLPGSSANSVFTFYNEPDIPNGGDGSIRKVDADNPTVGIPGAIIRITSVKLDDGGSFTSEYTTGDGGYIPKSDLDFGKLPKGSYIAEEITPPEGYILSSDVSKVKQPFVWDGEHDISLIFENSSKVRVQLKKVDESNAPLPGAIFVILRDGQVIGTEETQADGAITVSNVTEGYYQFREVSAPAGFDCDRSPVGVHVEAEDLQGEQTIVVTKMNHHKRSLTIQKRDAESGDPIPGTSFHIRGVNLGYENDVVTGADGKAVLESMPSGCYEITETDVPKPYILDSNNRKTVWIDAEKDKDVVVDFVNSKLPGVRLVKRDAQTNKPIPGATFKIEEVDGGFTDQRQTDKDGVIFWENLRPGAYKVYEVTPAPNYVHDDTVHVVQLEPNHTTTIELTNIIKPTLKVLKVDSVTHSPIANVKFQIWRGSDDTITGELNDLGTFQTNASGEIVLEHIDTGWYRIKELEPAPGFTIKQPDTQDIYLKAGETHTVQFENVPKNCIIVEKYDSVTGEALPGCTFQLRYLAGTSGTGGTVIGQKVTGKNGIAMWTGLEPGAYVIEEVDPADGYSIINSSETVYLADNGEQSVITVRFDNMPDGILLVRKVCATNPSITLQNAEFKITYADGTVIGDSNGIYRTDEKGEIRIEGLKPGKSVIVTEVQAPPGFIIDTQSQTIQIKEGRTSVLTFKNQPRGKLIIQKRDSATNAPLPGAEFRVTTAAGCEVGLDGVIGTSSLTQNGIFTTDAQGEIRITNLAPGAYVLTEIKAPDGYVMDTPSTNVVIGQGGDTQTVIVKNSKKGSLIINKKDSATGKPLEGVEFKVATSSGQVVADQEGKLSSNGIYFTNKDGQIVISGLKPDTYVVTEQHTIPGYIIHEATRSQTVVVDANDTQSLTFYNDPTATLVIHKYVEGTENEPLSGVAFKVTDGNGGAVGPDDGIYFTDKSGDITLTGLEPGMTVIAREVKTLDGFVLDSSAQSIQSNFVHLRSLAETIATSTNNAQVINAYDQYDAIIKRVSNDLDIMARQSKAAEQATREHEKAVKDDTAAQLTMTKSSTLSNSIESWMNQNTKAAQVYGDKLREIQALLANNSDPIMLAKARAELAKIKSEAKVAGLVTSQFATSLKNTTLQLLGLTSGVMVIRKIISVIKEGVNTVVELDTALVDLQKTTTMSGSDLVSFYEEANDAAKKLGVTTKDIIQSAADWSRLGYSDKTSSTMMAKLAAQFSAISPGVDIGTATTGLVSVMKAYGIEAEEVLDGVMSKINIVGNTAATSNAEIINGLQNSASAMAAMNSTLEENVALFTAAQEITQDDSKVGNALRSISMRVRGYDEETGELSEELANITGEVYDLTKATENSQGVSLFTDETQEHYKSVYQYLKDISEVYDDLSEKQQQQLMEKLFGKNRASVGQAILQNFEAAEKAMNNMAESAGNADAEMEIITKSLEFKLNALKETGTGIFQNLFKREEIGVIIDMLTGLASAIDFVTSLIGPFGTALAGVGIAAFVKNLD